MNDLGHAFGVTLAVGYALALMPFLLLSLAIPYAVLRLRSQDGPEADTQVGLKVFFYYFFSLGVLLALTGATVLAVDVISEKPPLPMGGPFGAPQRGHQFGDFTSIQRTGTSLVVTGVLVALFHWVVVKAATNDRRWPATRRLFAGWRLAIHGLILLMTVTALIHLLFQVDTNIETLKTLLAVGVVWSFAWVADLFLLWFHSRPVQKTEKPRRALLREVEEED